MLRLLVVIVVVVAALWYFTRDNASTTRIAEEQREDLELARKGVEITEQAAAAAAAQSDVIRDQALGLPAVQGEQEE